MLIWETQSGQVYPKLLARATSGGACTRTQEAPQSTLVQGVLPSSSVSPCLATWVNGPPSLSPFLATVV